MHAQPRQLSGRIGFAIGAIRSDDASQEDHRLVMRQQVEGDPPRTVASDQLGGPASAGHQHHAGRRRREQRADLVDIVDDETTEVRAVFSWSYRALDADAARLFRLLGLHPGPDIGIDAAAVLCASTTVMAERLLDRLASVHLLEETGPGRYGFHDLLRVYAADRAAIEESDVELHDSNTRILGWYLHSADTAVRTLWPDQPKKAIVLPAMDFRPLALATSEEARHWLAAEHPNLMAIIHHAATTGWHTLAWQLPLILVDYFIQGSHWVDLVAAQQIGLAAARQAGDREAEYWALTCLSEAYLELERFEEAVPHAEDALTLTREIGNRRGQGVALHDLGWALDGLGRDEEAFTHLEEALAIYREVGDRRGAGIVLCVTGEVLRKLRRLDEALDRVSQGIGVLRAIDNRWSEATGLRRLGRIQRDLLRFDDAIATLGQSQAIYRELGDRTKVAVTLRDLGELHLQAGWAGLARECWNEALGILDELNAPHAAKLRAQLDTLG